MNTSIRTSLHFAWLAYALVLACGIVTWTACEQIIGIEDRRRAADGGGGGPTMQACASYCKDVLQACDASNVQAYRNEEECLAVCSFLPPGRTGTSNDANNTLMCRAKAASEAEDDAASCPAASPGGGSPTAEDRCGSNCETYCNLYATVCEREQENCVDICEALPDRGGFSAEQDFRGGDTIQCRLSHLAAAAVHRRKGETAKRRTECDNAQLSAALGRREYCDVPDNTVPDCPGYCRLVQAACVANPVYETQAQCEAACDVLFPKGTNTTPNGQDSTSDTLACRRWHAHFALIDEEMGKRHCPHAGPSGDGHCSGTDLLICGTYCSMLQRACKNVYDREFPGPGGLDMCTAMCKRLPGALNDDGLDYETGYDLSAEESRTNTLQCRIANLADAMSGMNACMKALPTGTCSR